MGSKPGVLGDAVKERSPAFEDFKANGAFTVARQEWR